MTGDLGHVSPGAPAVQNWFTTPQTPAERLTEGARGAPRSQTIT